MVNGEPMPPGSDPSAPSPDEELTPRDEGLTTICPECGGVLTERAEAGVTQWRCRVGHRYSPESLLNAQAEDVEAAMWAAVRALEDRRILLERMAARFESREQAVSARSVRRRAEEAGRQADVVREALEQAAVTSLREIEPNGVVRELGTDAQESEEGLAS